ncbi:hypothetical protein HZB01_03185 [Candidatus Woesearchaeota archaeon]|nr:hypothetical protein [Candidatus Woesearchaeota archaeon]
MQDVTTLLITYVLHYRRRIEGIISQNYRVEFLGKDFDKVVHLLTETKVEKIYGWIEDVVKDRIQPIGVGSKKPYKQWIVKELLTFRYPFCIGNIEYRILCVKVKNSIYIEFHLGDHKYYDKVRKDLDLKKSSY